MHCDNFYFETLKDDRTDRLKPGLHAPGLRAALGDTNAEACMESRLQPVTVKECICMESLLQPVSVIHLA